MRRDFNLLFTKDVARQKSIKLSNGQRATILVAKKPNDAEAVNKERRNILSYIKSLDAALRKEG